MTSYFSGATIRARLVVDTYAVKFGLKAPPKVEGPKKADPGSVAKFLQLGGSRLVDDRECLLGQSMSLLSEHGDKVYWAEGVKNVFRSLVFKQRQALAAGVHSSATLPNAEALFKDLLTIRDGYSRSSRTDDASSMVYAIGLLLSLCIERAEPDSEGPGSSNFNLAPLYGTGSQSKSLRLLDGSGMLVPDSFAEEHTALLPPSLLALLVLFNRNHNAIARGLRIRYPNRWTGSTQLRDDELFTLARTINCLTFRNLVAEDLLKGVLGLRSVDPNVDLGILKDPGSANTKQGKPFEGKDSNQARLSIPLYNWSSLISDSDEAALHAGLEALSADYGALHSYEDILEASKRAGEGNPQPCTRSYPSLVRKGEVFSDSDLFDILRRAIESPAGRGGARQQPESLKLKLLEIHRIEKFRAGSGGALTLNDYRKWLGLSALKSFKEWNSDPSVAEAAETLYSNIDNLEAYAGLLAEEAPPSLNGGGLGLGYTMTFALVVDICARVRGDPLASLLNSDTLTVFGFKECSIDRYNGAYGSVLPKLLCRNLPAHFPPTNIYTVFPFSIPERTRAALRGPVKSDAQGAANETGKEATQPSLLQPQPQEFGLYDTVLPASGNVVVPSSRSLMSQILNNPRAFPTPYTQAFREVTHGYGYLLGFDQDSHGTSVADHDADLKMTMYSLFPDSSIRFQYAKRFKRLVQDAIIDAHKAQMNLTGKSENAPWEINIVKDVINPVCTRWVCETLCDYQLPNKDRLQKLQKKRWPSLEERKEIETLKNARPVEEIYQEFTLIYAYVIRNFDPEDSCSLREKAIHASDFLTNHIREKIPLPRWLSPKGFWINMRASQREFGEYVVRTVHEFFGGQELRTLTAQTFLERVVQAAKGNTTLVHPGHQAKKLQVFQHFRRRLHKIRKIREPQDDHDEEEINFQQARIVANVLGLSAVTTVALAEACSIVVDFYLDPERKNDLQGLIDACNPKSKLKPEDANHLIMGYFNEALRIKHHSAVWRVAKETTVVNIPADQGHNESLVIQAGDRVYINFSQLHHSHEEYPDPEVVKPLRPRTKQFVKGLGFHKCPANMFIDSVVPEMMKVIFQLENLKIQSSGGGLVRVYPRGNNGVDEPPRYLHPSGEISPFPNSLLVEFKPSEDVNKPHREATFAKTFRGGEGRRSRYEKWEKRFDIGLKIFNIAVILYLLFRIFSFFFWLLAGPKIAFKVVSVADVKVQNVECPQPLVIWNDWEVANITTGYWDDTPKAFVYTSNRDVPHRVAVYDIDKRDMRLSVWVDDEVRGLTRDFELDDEIDCGQDLGCAQDHKFSAGLTTVGAGKHTVRIEWAGKEFFDKNGTLVPALGTNAVRRFMWTRSFCGRVGEEL